jgi:methyltransferase family protein
VTATSISEEIRRFWDDDAASYDTSPPHHPRRPRELAAWDRRAAPPAAGPSRHGAGRRDRHGFLPPPLTRQGYQVTTVDLSAAMLQILTSQGRPRELAIDTTNADAVSPPQPDPRAVVERHLLWTLPDPGMALAAWRAAAPAAGWRSSRDPRAAPVGHYARAYR